MVSSQRTMTQMKKKVLKMRTRTTTRRALSRMTMKMAVTIISDLTEMKEGNGIFVFPPIDF